MKKQSLLLTLGFLLLVTAQAQLKLDSKLPQDEKVKMGKLANGLTYYIRANQKPEKKVELRLVVNAGSILEDNDQQGLAHFTEHMAFNGTKNFKKNELVSFLQSIGVDFGADLNAYTSFNETVYILPIPLSDPGNYKKGMQVLQDWASGLTFENKQIDDERAVVLEESRLGKGAEDRMFRKVYPRQYAGSKYATRLPIGKDSILKTFKYDAIKRFYRDWYRPNLMAVIVVGDINVAETEKMIQEYFGALKNPSNPRPRTIFPLQSRKAPESMVLTDKEATNIQISIEYSPVKSSPEITLNDYRRENILKRIFVSLLNQRLQELSRSANPPFTYAGVGFGSFARDFEAFSGFAIAGKKGADTAFNALATEIERVKKFGFTQSELDRAKKQQFAAIERSYNNRDKTESSVLVEEYIRNFLEAEPIPGIENEFNYKKELLPGIKLEEVNAFANEIKKTETVFVSVMGPDKADVKMPVNTALLASLDNIAKTPLKAYEEKVIASSLLKVKPASGNITKETKNELLGTTELQFSNGARVIIKPTNFKQDEIILGGFKKGGLNNYGVDDKFSATYASQVVSQMGIGEFNPTDLQKFLAGKIANVSVGLNAISTRVNGNCVIKDAETMLQLLYLNFTNIRKDEALFNGWKEKQKSQMQFILSDPTTAFIDSAYKVIYANQPLAPVIVPTPEIFDKINLDRAVAIFKENTADANDFTFTLTGNVDIEAMKPLLAIYIGGLPSKGTVGSFKDNGVRIVSGKKELNFYKGKEQKSFILNVYSGEVPYSEDLALKAEMLTEILNIKIIEDLREKIGGIYGGGIGGGLSKYPYNSYSFGLQLPCGPEKVDVLKKAADEEIEKIRTKGPEQVDIDKVKKSLLEKYKVNMKDNKYWSGILNNIYFSDNDPQRYFDYEKIVNAVTGDQIKEAANLLLSGKNVVRATLYPEKN
jgi:zinc protease